LAGAGSSTIEIAQALQLKKMQISAILAHKKLKEDPTDEFEEIIPTPTLRPEEIEELENTVVEPLGRQDEDPPQGIYIGRDKEYDDMLYWDPTDTKAVPNPHLMIIGESGSGKTYATECLIAELNQRKIPSIVFDYGQSFEWHSLEKAFLKYANPKEHLIGEEGLALNPLQIFPNDIQGPNTVATRLADVFDAVYRLGAIQSKVLIDAVVLAFERVGITPPNRQSWSNAPPTLAVLKEVLEELATSKEYANYKNATGVAARLTTFFMLNSFRNDGPPWSWEQFIDDTSHPVNILQFRGLEGKTQRIVVELLLWHLFFYLKSKGQNKLQLYCVLDEAHHLSFRDSGPINFLLREGRKFGLGIIFASQQPEDFSPAAFANSASKLVFQTTDTSQKVSKLLSSKCTNYSGPDQIHEVISVLPQGNAFFITKNKGHVVGIEDIKKRATLWI
jgi:DNA phosphorothioation-dependent restriction protein DptH